MSYVIDNRIKRKCFKCMCVKDIKIQRNSVLNSVFKFQIANTNVNKNLFQIFYEDLFN